MICAKARTIAFAFTLVFKTCCGKLFYNTNIQSKSLLPPLLTDIRVKIIGGFIVSQSQTMTKSYVDFAVAEYIR